MGQSGLDWVLYGRATFDYLKQAKEVFISALEPGVHYPQDIFLFRVNHKQQHFWFFRTKDDDPEVYGYEGQSWFYRLADTLSEFVLQELDSNPDQITERWERRHQITYCYDVSQDELVQCVNLISEEAKSTVYRYFDTLL